MSAQLDPVKEIVRARQAIDQLVGQRVATFRVDTYDFHVGVVTGGCLHAQFDPFLIVQLDSGPIVEVHITHYFPVGNDFKDLPAWVRQLQDLTGFVAYGHDSVYGQYGGRIVRWLGRNHGRWFTKPFGWIHDFIGHRWGVFS